MEQKTNKALQALLEAVFYSDCKIEDDRKSRNEEKSKEQNHRRKTWNLFINQSFWTNAYKV